MELTMLNAPKIVLTTFGSLGDLHPFMALGLALKKCGAEVVLASHPDYQAKVEAAGLRFVACGPSMETYRRNLGIEPAEIIRHFSQDHGFMLKHLVAPYIEQGLSELRPIVREADLVVSSSYAYTAHLAARLEGRPFSTVALQPAVMLSAYDPPKLKDAPLVLSPRTELGRQYNRAIFWIGEKKLAGCLAPIRAVYTKYGVDMEISLGGVQSDQLTLGLYSPLMGDVAPDYPPRTEIVGFPFFDSEDGRRSELPPQLEAFLSNGPAPLVFSLGSIAVHDGEDFYRTAAKAAKCLNQRAVLLVGGHSPLLNEDFGADVLCVPYAPHSLLMPRARINIHHGGIGSTAQALRAGRPQLVTPVFGDQFDNGRRIERLGSGLSITFDRWHKHSATRLLDRLLYEPAFARKATQAAEGVAAEDGAERAAQRLLENLKVPA
ncbi:MAG: glycosyltransferase [Asticcacaulis sp.]